MRDGGLLEAQFYEPGGICVADKGRTLFVSDTNNNCIRKIDLESKTVEQVSREWKHGNEDPIGWHVCIFRIFQTPLNCFKFL